MSETKPSSDGKFGLSLRDRNSLELVISSNLMPNEKLIWLGKENCKRVSARQSPSIAGAVADTLKQFSIDYRSSLATLGDMLLLIFLILVLGVLIVSDLRATDAVRGAYLLLEGGLLLVAFLIMSGKLAGRVFAITNQRLICLSLPKRKIKWWVSLDNLKSVELQDLDSESGDMKFHFAAGPIGMAGKELQIMDVTLKGIEKPAEIKNAIMGDRTKL